MDFSRLRTGEIVAAVGGLALFIFMFFHWFGGGVEISTGGTQDVPGIGEVPNAPSVEETGVSGWDALSDFSGFLIALSAVSGVALGGLAASGQRLNLGGVPRGAGTATLGSLAVLLILWRFFANPGDLKIGIFLGLAAAIAVAVGALMALREEGFEPLVKVPGVRTRAASASAPAATPTPRPATAPSGGKNPAKKSTAKKKSASEEEEHGKEEEHRVALEIQRLLAFEERLLLEVKGEVESEGGSGSRSRSKSSRLPSRAGRAAAPPGGASSKPRNVRPDGRRAHRFGRGDRRPV